MGKTLLIVIFLSSSVTGYSQYFQFSQYNFTSQRINPAQLGLSNNASVSTLYRNQKTGGDFDLNSNFIAASYPFLNQSTGRSWSGIGISFLGDRSSGIFNAQEAAISYAINVRLSRYQMLSVGFKGLYHSQRISYDGFYTGSQYVTDQGFDTSLSNGENPPLRNNYLSLSTGLYWQQTDRREIRTGYWGVSIFDFNKPQNSFLGNSTRLAPSLVIMGGIQVYRKKKFSIKPELLYTFNTSNHVLNVGTTFNYELQSTPKLVTSSIDIISKYVPGRSGIFGLQLHREKFSAGVSYDFPLIKKNVGNLGALEVGFELRKPVKSKAKKMQERRIAEQAKKIKNQKPMVTKNLNDTTIKSEEIIQIAETKPELVEIAKIDSAQGKGLAKAGKLSQESLLMEKITLHFGFEFNSFDLDDDTESFLNDLSETLKEDESLNVMITGHTDNIGNEKFNQKLSLKRADAIRNFLVKSGISENRLKTEGKGLSDPLVPNDSEVNRAKNRRVEMAVFHKQP